MPDLSRYEHRAGWIECKGCDGDGTIPTLIPDRELICPVCGGTGEVPPMDSFTCAHCHGTFDKAWSDEQAKAEADELWGDDLGHDPAVVCDDCFQRMTAVTATDIPAMSYAAMDRMRELAIEMAKARDARDAFCRLMWKVL